ncbi:MAG: rod shape-determining protein RodA [Planctomycetota bacterium]|jgi:rod shape determining protein RodA
MNAITVKMKCGPRAFSGNFNWMVAVATAGLVAISVVFVFSASFHAASQEYARFARMQVVWVMLGVAAAGVVMLLKSSLLKALAPLCYGFSIALLVAVFFIGTAHKGAMRWIVFGPLRIQPSEIAKLATVMMLAWYFAAMPARARSLKGLAGALLIALVPILLILKEPDLGTAMIFLPVTAALLFAAGAKKRHLALLLAVTLAAVPLGWLFVLKPYQKGRLLVFLDPENPQRVMKKFMTAEELKSVRFADGYHLRQSMTAVGSGGITGKGYKRGTQNTLGYLPERHTDFIFAVIAEEWGLIGCLGLLALFGFLLFGCAEAASRTADPFARFLTVGVLAIITTQVIINVGMNIGLFPITGLTLPFVSYGGSSMVSSLLGIALVLNLDLRTEREHIRAVSE